MKEFTISPKKKQALEPLKGDSSHYDTVNPPFLGITLNILTKFVGC